MLRLGLIFYLFIGTTLAGSAMVIALASGNDTMQPVIISALVGAVIGIPVTWFVARAVHNS